LRRLPEEIDLPQSDLIRAMIAWEVVSKEREDRIKELSRGY